MLSGEDEPAFGGRNGTAQFLCCLNPFLNDNFGIRQGFQARGAVCGAPGKLRHLCDEGAVFLALVKDDSVPTHRRPIDFLLNFASGAGAPRNRPSELRSSSISGQWIP